MSNYAEPLERIKAWLRTSRHAAMTGDYDAAMIAADVMAQVIKQDLIPAYGAEMKRRQALEAGK